MIRSLPTPARASNEASADPVAPQPTMAILPAASCCWPLASIPRNRICLEYRSSNLSLAVAPSCSKPCLKEVTGSFPQNLYYKWDRFPPAVRGTTRVLRASSKYETDPRKLFAEKVRRIRHRDDGFARPGGSRRATSHFAAIAGGA